MGIPFQERTPLGFLPVAAILIIGAILLNSCGQGNPAGSPQSSAVTNTSQPAGPTSSAATTQLLSVVKSTPTSITIRVNPPDPAQKYTLFMSDSYKIDASTAAKVPTNSGNTYSLNLAPEKTYMFLLVMEVTDRIGKNPVLAYIISKPGKNNKARMNLINENAVPGIRALKSATPTTSNLQTRTAFDGPQCGFYGTYYYQPWKLNLIVGGFFPIFSYSNAVGPIFLETVMDYVTVSPVPLPPFPDSTCYDLPHNGWDYTAPTYPCYYDYRFMGFGNSGYIPCGPQPLSITVSPDTATIPVGGTQQYTAIGSFPDGSVSDITSQAAWNTSCTPDNEYGIAYVDEYGIATGRNIGTCQVTATLENVTSSPATLIVGNATINVSPASATAYLHPTPTPVQFTAKDSNNNDITYDPKIRWTSSDDASATVNGGLALPLKPSDASITAALLDRVGNVNASGSATLEIMCRAYQYWPQDGMPYSTQFLGYTTMGNTIGKAGCALTSTAMLLSGANIIYEPGQLNTTYKNLAPIKTGYSKVDGKWHTDSLGFSDAKIIWNAVGLANVSQGNISYKKALSTDDPTYYTAPLAISSLDSLLDQCYAVIAGIRTSTTDPTRHHYVLVIGREGNKHRINDPGWSKKYLEDFNNGDIYSMNVYSFIN